MGGCLGCYTKPELNTPEKKTLRDFRVKGHSARKPSLSEDYWTTSMCDMDNSISSISTNNQVLEAQGVAGIAGAPSEFVNHGLLLWNQTRQRWVGNKRSENRAQQVQEPKLNWNATYDSLLGSNKLFPQPIPLSEMVDFLVDVWEQEGMYD
ncbi:uncharacterized protein LOC123219241 isoform X2 [Mangifera indica]|uniref:uncharacterized protein LOC123219241 isoform X2 n=1 Tax=Mangifera indica TaxID=29780 RepID=UPI001CFB4B16|nr:uncharacterized protein LOC123219241 isoform X2 [Mangifera indica]